MHFDCTLLEARKFADTCAIIKRIKVPNDGKYKGSGDSGCIAGKRLVPWFYRLPESSISKNARRYKLMTRNCFQSSECVNFL